jgi:hypothetical protein
VVLFSCTKIDRDGTLHKVVTLIFGLGYRFQWILAFQVFVSFSNLAAFTFVLMTFAADRLALKTFHVLLCFPVKASSFLQLRTRMSPFHSNVAVAAAADNKQLCLI